MFKRLLPFIALAILASPALAGRTAIDQNPDGTPLTYRLSGYCDFNGEDCDGGSGLFLPYSVSIGGQPFTNRAIVHGNGLLTFGSAFQFFDNPDVSDKINNGTDPALTEYGLTLVSAGQNNTLDSGNAFLQSASLQLVPDTSTIKASWYTCNAPSAPGVCPRSNLTSLTLTPTKAGFAGHFDTVTSGSDRGYVSGGAYTATGQDFVLAATFEGLPLGVPEPASWAMMIAGFGLVGAASRRRAREYVTSS